MDPRIRIRIHPKMSWIRNTAPNYSYYLCTGTKKTNANHPISPEIMLKEKKKPHPVEQVHYS
jgi:hypothetical protein